MKIFLFAAILAIGTVVPHFVVAKEGQFEPFFADIWTGSAGEETLQVQTDGSLLAMTSAGRPVPGFPVFLENQVFVSDPVQVDFLGDGNASLFVLSRNADGVVYGNNIGFDGSLLHQFQISRVRPGVQPIVVPAQKRRGEMVLLTGDGKIKKLYFLSNRFRIGNMADIDGDYPLVFDKQTLQVIARDYQNQLDHVFVWRNDVATFIETRDMAASQERTWQLWGYTSNSSLRYFSLAHTFQTTLFSGNSHRPIPHVQNVVLDGDFETLEYQWRNYGSPIIKRKTTQHAYSGRNAMLIHTDFDERTGGGMQQLNLPVLPGRSYVLSFWYKLERGALYPRLGIRSSNSDFERKYDILGAVNGNWTQYQREFTVPEDFAGDFRFVLSTRRAKAYIDDIKIQEKPLGGLVADGSMESAGIASWVYYGNPEVVEKSAEEFYAGNQSLRINTLLPEPHGGGVQQRFLPVEAGKAYRLSYWYKVLAGELRPRVGIRSSNSDFEGRYDVLRVSGDNWQQFRREFVVPEDFEDDFRLVFATRRAEVHIDHVLLEEIIEPTIVVDGDAESIGMAAWNTYGRPDILEKRSDIVHSGVFSIFLDNSLTGRGAGFQQRYIAVEPGGRYKLQFYYKLVSGEVKPRLGIRSSNSDFEGLNERLRMISDQWQVYEREFIVPQDFTTDFRLILSAPKSTVYFDDISIIRIDE